MSWMVAAFTGRIFSRKARHFTGRRSYRTPWRV